MGGSQLHIRPAPPTSALGEGAMAVSFIHASLDAALPVKDISASAK